MNGDTLLNYQKKYIADTAEVRVAEKSRRVGLTWADAADSVLTAAQSGGMDCYYISYNMEFTKEYIRTCAFWAEALGYAAGELEEVIIKDEDKDVTAYQIRFDSGKKVVGLPGRATTLRGRQGKVTIDEAAFVDDLREIIKAAMALLMWGGKVSIISTHNGEESFFNEIVQDTIKGRLPYSHHRITIEQALEAGLFKRICQTQKNEWSEELERNWLNELVDYYGEGADEELFCVPSRSGLKYFPRLLVENCMDSLIPVFTYTQEAEFTYKDEFERERATADWLSTIIDTLEKIESHHSVFLGMDFARSGDLSIIAIQEEMDDLTLKGVCYLEMRNIPFMQQWQVLRYVIDFVQRFGGGSIDARGNGQQIAEMAAQEYGEEIIHQVMITRAFYAEYMPKHKARFEDKGLKIPKHAGILDDYRTVVLEKGIPLISERTGSGKEKRHGDAVVAGCMVEHAVANSDGGYHPYSYEAVESGVWK